MRHADSVICASECSSQKCLAHKYSVAIGAPSLPYLMVIDVLPGVTVRTTIYLAGSVDLSLLPDGEGRLDIVDNKAAAGGRYMRAVVPSWFLTPDAWGGRRDMASCVSEPPNPKPPVDIFVQVWVAVCRYTILTSLHFQCWSRL